MDSLHHINMLKLLIIQFALPLLEASKHFSDMIKLYAGGA
jgi:hypothetical protein